MRLAVPAFLKNIHLWKRDVAKQKNSADGSARLGEANGLKAQIVAI